MVNLGFWEKLKKPIMVLAPLANVTDAAFRSIITKYGKPDVIWTEFVSADGLILGRKEILLKDLLFDKSERPIVAQLFTAKPDIMEKAARLVRELGFDGVDINMGCPDRSVERQGAGAALMKKPELAREIIRAAKNGAAPLPVSVKTRVGYSKNELEAWLPEILAEEPAVVIIHARTRKEMSAVPARWELVKRAVEIRDEIQKNIPKSERTLILGNGDLKNISDAKEKVKETGADGAMLGRAIFGNPWLFNRRKKIEKIAKKEKLRVMIEHTKLFEKLLGDVKKFANMRKHYKAYVSGFDGAKELRTRLMEAEAVAEVEKIVKEIH